MPINIAPRNIQPTAGTTTPATSNSDLVGGDELYVSVTGLSPANLADAGLLINLIVEGRIGGVFRVIANMGGWQGGMQAKNQPPGTFVPCEFGFRNPALNQLDQYRLTYSTNKLINAGLSVVPQNVTSAAKVQ